MRKQYSRNEIYPYLIQSLHSEKSATDFFRNHLDDDKLLAALVEVALADVSDDARMEAAFWISQFPADTLEPFQKKLEQLSLKSWDSITTHAKTALNKVAKLEAYATAP